MNCWLYDICQIPVNHFNNQQRREFARKGIPELIRSINDLHPEYIIFVKRSLREIVFNTCLEIGYEENENVFYIPFPACGQQTNYVNELSNILVAIYCESHK